MTTLINGKIFTMVGKPIENGFVRMDGGKIKETGPMSDFIPEEGEQTADLSGKIVTPGLIDAHTHLGMFEDGINFEGDDGNEETDPATPQLRAIDAVNPMDRSFSEALAAGVTAVVTGPGSANPLGGQMAAIKTCGRRIDRMIIKAPAAQKMAFGENPKTVYHEKNQAPVTRMAVAAVIRENLLKAKEYLERKERAEADEEEDPPEFDFKCESLLPLLRREIPAHIHVHRADDIFTAIRIAKEFSLDYVLVHCTEGHLIAEELAQEGAKIVVGPFLTDRSKPELQQLSPSTPGLLAAKGLEVAICTDHPVIPLRWLPLCAAVAVKEGMTEEDALRAITVNPARLVGIDDRVGTLAAGRDADIAVFDGSPLDVRTKVTAVFVDGHQETGALLFCRKEEEE